GRAPQQGAGRDRSAAAGVGGEPGATVPHRNGAGDHGKSTRALGGSLQERPGQRAAAQEALMGAYGQLTAAGVPTRQAAALTGVSRATAARRQKPPATPVISRPEPANRLTEAERATVLAVLCSDEFVDASPM